MPASEPPRSSQIPGKSSGSGAYVGGILVLALLAGGLFWWRGKRGPTTPESTATTAALPTVAAPAEPPPMNAPPPPPKLEEEDAGSDAAAPAKTATAASGPPRVDPCSVACTGSTTGALSSALRSMAGSAQGCYQRALRTSEVSGSMTVAVQVGPSGSVCSASIAADSVHSNEIASCVLSRFRGKSFPAPSNGCVTVNIPISFTIKQ